MVCVIYLNKVLGDRVLIHVKHFHKTEQPFYCISVESCFLDIDSFLIERSIHPLLGCGGATDDAI